MSFPNLKKGEKIIGSASEMLNFIICLPFALIDKEMHFDKCPVWSMILCLRKVVNILMAFKLSTDQIAVLQSLWNEYMELRKLNFPDKNPRTKHHFISHYPYLIRHFGPLRHLWTLRFESKHKYFKNIVKHSPSFKNILLTLSTKHQFLMALNSRDANLYHDIL